VGNVPRCIVCEREGPFRYVFGGRGYGGTMVSCPRCGLVFQSPQPDEDVLARSYYHDAEFSEMLMGPLRCTTVERAREKLPLLAGVSTLRPGERALDVGCSSGAWLEVAQELGMPAAGVEIGERTSQDARARGLDVRTGTLEECFPDGSEERFELITFWDVLEHLSDPRRELASARRLLAPGGILAATCPNVAGLYPQATYRLLARPAGAWEYPELPVHLYDFSPATLRRLLERSGFAVAGLRTYRTPFRFYRQTSLSRERLGGGARALALRLAFEAMRAVVYPIARRLDRENSLFVAARVGESRR